MKQKAKKTTSLNQLKTNRKTQFIAVILVLVIGGFGAWLVARPDTDSGATATNLVEENIEKTVEETLEDDPADLEPSNSQAIEQGPAAGREAASNANPCPGAVEEGDRCVYTLDASRTPARLETYNRDVNGTSDTSATDLIMTCHTAGACQQYNGGATVTQETVKRADWKIVSPTKITMKAKKSNGSYKLVGFTYWDANGQAQCTSNMWYCYAVGADYVKN